MQLKTLVLAALAAVATAAPSDADAQHHKCEPATYQCLRGGHHKPGWQVCDTSGNWQVCLSPPSPLPLSSTHAPMEEGAHAVWCKC